jgi:hypothetical protein
VERATTLSSQTTGQRAGSVHLVEKRCSFFLLHIQKHSWRARGQEGPRGIGSGCEAPSVRTRHNTEARSARTSAVLSLRELSRKGERKIPGSENDKYICVTHDTSAVHDDPAFGRRKRSSRLCLPRDGLNHNVPHVELHPGWRPVRRRVPVPAIHTR